MHRHLDYQETGTLLITEVKDVFTLHVGEAVHL